MPDNENGTEKKKYQVIDKRQAARETPPEAVKQQQPEAEKAPEPPGEPGAAPRASQPDPADAGPGSRAARIEDAMHFALNMLREHALDALCMLLPPKDGRKPDVAKAQRAAEVYSGITSKFPALVAAPPEMTPEEERFRSDLGSVLIMALNIIQGQIVINMGLMADPASGLIMRDMPQAQKGIDFFAAVKDAAGAQLPPEVSKQLEAVVTDLRLNYVNQLKNPQ